MTSGRPGRFQAIYQVPEQYWDEIATKKIATGVKDNDGKPEQLELQWDGCQSIVAGAHPLTGSYHWVPDRSPEECQIAEAPDWIIQQMLEKKSSQQSAQAKSHNQTATAWTDEERALSYLAAIPPTEDYDTWLRVGMALYSVNPDLLIHWIEWSMKAANYEPGVCERKWNSFKPDKGIGLGTLGWMAQQNGWQSPFQESRSVHSAPTKIEGNSSAPAISFSVEEVDENREELAQEVQSFVKLIEEPAPIQKLLSPLLMTPLRERAKQFNVPPETFVGLLLPVIASLLRIGTQLEIDVSTEYYCLPILWAGLVGESGTNKSPIFDTILKPLKRLQAEADELYQAMYEQYEDDLENWQNCSKEERGNKPTPPIQHEYYLQDTTLEAMADRLSKQPNQGVVIPIDERNIVKSGVRENQAASLFK